MSLGILPLLTCSNFRNVTITLIHSCMGFHVETDILVNRVTVKQGEKDPSNHFYIMKQFS